MKAKEGDLYKIDLDSEECGYFQYLLLDPCQLNSEVIRVFNFRGKKEEIVDFSLIFSSGISFYTHVVIKFGLKLEFWNRLGNYPLEKNFKAPLFRDTSGHRDEYDGNRIIYNKSNSWNVWRAGDPFQKRKKIGLLTKEYENIDLGLVNPPNEVIYRMLTGDYSYPYYT
jgi:hypothetical protein